jgi:hypothetical protein
MIFARDDDNLFVCHLVNEAMFIGQTARPVTFKFVLERFRFADSLDGCPGNFAYSCALCAQTAFCPS